MAIRIEHQPSGAAVGAAAFAAGAGKARQRQRKYAMDLQRDNQKTIARRQELFAGQRFRGALEGERQRFALGRDVLQREQQLGDAELRRDQAVADAERNRGFDIEDDAQTRQHGIDMATDRGLLAGDLVVSPTAQATIDKIEASIGSDDYNRLDEAGKAEFREKAAERIRTLRREGATQPKEQAPLDVANKNRFVVGDDGQLRPRQEGDGPPTHTIIDGQAELLPEEIQRREDAAGVAEAAKSQRDATKARIEKLWDKEQEARNAEAPNVKLAQAYKAERERLENQLVGAEGGAAAGGGDNLATAPDPSAGAKPSVDVALDHTETDAPAAAGADAAGRGRPAGSPASGEEIWDGTKWVPVVPPPAPADRNPDDTFGPGGSDKPMLINVGGEWVTRTDAMDAEGRGAVNEEGKVWNGTEWIAGEELPDPFAAQPTNQQVADAGMARRKAAYLAPDPNKRAKAEAKAAGIEQRRVARGAARDAGRKARLGKAPRGGSVPKVRTAADYQRLQSGEIFDDPDGNRRRKP